MNNNLIAPIREIYLLNLTHIFSENSQNLFDIIFETNLINLSIVLVVVIRFIGGALLSTLESRRQLIVQSLENSNKKIVLVKTELNKAKERLNKTKIEINELHNNRLMSFSKIKKVYLSQTTTYLSQLNTLKTDIIQSQTKKVLTDVYNQIIILTFSRMLKGVETILPSTTVVSNSEIGKQMRFKLKLNYLNQLKSLKKG